jgi:hypothetical protein|tara:strand:+ start:1751 stop:1990 length:240 start_codon:yes stop_codon:yes gene_type:complete
MQYLLIAAALNLNVIYADLDTCNVAKFEIERAGHQALCIPKGKDYRFTEKSNQMDTMFDKFLELVKELQKMEHSHTKED